MSQNSEVWRSVENLVSGNKGLNRIYYLDSKGPGGGCHEYSIENKRTGEVLGTVSFQCGGRNEAMSVAGVRDEDLLEIVRHRMRAFKNAPTAGAWTEYVLLHVEFALELLEARRADREERGVLGTQKE